MFENFTRFSRTLSISWKLGTKHGIILTLDDPLFEPVCRLITTMIRTSDMTDDQIVELIVHMIKMKKLLKEAKEKINKWAKIIGSEDDPAI